MNPTTKGIFYETYVYIILLTSYSSISDWL